MGERGQIWSMDLIIGVLIFMLAIGIIYMLLGSRTGEDITPLRIESEIIATKLTDDSSLAIASNNQLDTQKLAQLTSADYEQLKSRLGVRNEFCIYLRDDAGNLTYIVDENGNLYSGIGSGTGELNLSGTPCGCKVGRNSANCKA